MSFRFREKIKSKSEEQVEQQSVSPRPPAPPLTAPAQASGGSQVCSVCQKKLYVMERLSAEGLFFHRGCFQCCQCRRTLRLGDYAFNQSSGESSSSSSPPSSEEQAQWAGTFELVAWVFQGGSTVLTTVTLLLLRGGEQLCLMELPHEDRRGSENFMSGRLSTVFPSG